LEVNNLGSLKKTIAGTSYGVYRHKFLKNNTIFIHDHKEAIKLERDSYKGGRTECFKLGNIKNITSLDVNSMHPYVMKNYKMPIRLIGYSSKEKSGKDFIKFYKNAKKRGYLVIADIDFNLPEGYNHIGVKSKIGKDKIPSLIFPIGIIRSSLTSPEIDYVIKHGDILKVHRISLYEGKNIFKDFVDYFYKMRQGYKKNNNLAYSIMTKLILNSLYGKFGQKNPITRSLKFGDGKFEIYHKEIQDLVDDEIIFTNAYRIGSVGWYGTGEYEEGRDSFVAISSFVSAYARMYLSKIMNVAGTQGTDYIYSDTDSLFVSDQGLRRCREAGFLGDQLGQLKKEKTGDVELKGCKDYVFNSKVKLKGVKKDAIEIDNGVYEQERFIRLKTALKYGLTKDQYTYMEIKKLSRRYKKGVVKDNGSVKPYYLRS
jgi:DNA polymerase elongation subunit (family B)